MFGGLVVVVAVGVNSSSGSISGSDGGSSGKSGGGSSSSSARMFASLPELTPKYLK